MHICWIGVRLSFWRIQNTNLSWIWDCISRYNVILPWRFWNLHLLCEKSIWRCLFKDRSCLCRLYHYIMPKWLHIILNINLAKDGIIRTTEHPNSLGQIRYLETRKPNRQDEPEVRKSAPFFSKPLKPEVQVSESEQVILECKVQPTDDPDLEINWLFNQQLLPSGHKFKLTNDFGHVTLVILYTYAEDSGIYTCEAKNRLGSASTQCSVKCYSKKSMLLEPCQPDSIRAIQILETPKRHPAEIIHTNQISPVFLTSPRSYENLIEGQSLHLECHVRPTDDANLSITWLKDGQPLQASHRFKHLSNFGYVGLDFLQVYPEDSGLYTCRAKNNMGVAEVSCSLNCRPLKSILLESAHPESLGKIHMLEHHVVRKPNEPEVQQVQPYFTQQLTGPVEVLHESQTAHLQCRYEPNADPNLKIDWLFNGQPLTNASRIRMMNNFGFGSIDIIGVIPEDSGVYSVIVKNAVGSARSDFEIRCRCKWY